MSIAAIAVERHAQPSGRRADCDADVLRQEMVDSILVAELGSRLLLPHAQTPALEPELRFCETRKRTVSIDYVFGQDLVSQTWRLDLA